MCAPAAIPIPPTIPGGGGGVQSDAVRLQDAEEFGFRHLEAQGLHRDFQLVVVDAFVLVEVEEAEGFVDLFALLLGEEGHGVGLGGGLVLGLVLVGEAVALEGLVAGGFAGVGGGGGGEGGGALGELGGRGGGVDVVGAGGEGGVGCGGHLWGGGRRGR